MIKLDMRELTDALVKVDAVCDELPQIAGQVQQEALAHLILGAGRNIYDTTAGAYERTQDLLRGLDARSRAGRNTASVTVSGSAPYHAYVELGTGPHETSVQQAQAVALANPNPAAPLYLGRSGVNYSLPGPIVAPGQAFALHRMGELFAGKVGAALR